MVDDNEARCEPARGEGLRLDADCYRHRRLVIPSKKAVTSGAPAYNVFHLLFGLLASLLRAVEALPGRSTSGSGAIDLYQAVASRRGLFPQRWFRWKTADDVLHVVIGVGLVAAGLIQRGSSAE